MKKLRKQVSIDFLTHCKNSINDLLRSKIPQSTKQKLCIMMEKLLQETKEDATYKYLYWNKYGQLDWDEAKTKGVYKEIPKSFIYGPDYDGKPEFVSDIQGEFSRHYNIG
jgi:hypothetical protein